MPLQDAQDTRLTDDWMASNLRHYCTVTYRSASSQDYGASGLEVEICGTVQQRQLTGHTESAPYWTYFQHSFCAVCIDQWTMENCESTNLLRNESHVPPPSNNLEPGSFKTRGDDVSSKPSLHHAAFAGTQAALAKKLHLFSFS